MPLASPARVRAQKDALRSARRTLLLRLFVGGSSDVAAERARVPPVVDHFHRGVGDELRLDVLMWENYDTPDWRPPQAAIFDNVRFDDIDLFVGVFWWKAGTPTGTFDPQTGEEYPGGTFAELARAKELYQEGQVRRILLYFCDRPPPPEADPEQVRRVMELRTRLERGPDRAFYRTFRTAEDFADQLRDDLAAATDEFVPRRRAPAVIPQFVAKLCDRYSQEADFANFYTAGLRDHRGTVHACVLWGDKGEGHESFVERLLATRLRRVAERAWPGEDARVADHEPRWPEGGTFAEMQRRLPRLLVDEFDDGYMDGDLSAAAVTALPAFRRARLVVLHHDVQVTRWTAATERLLAWYLDEYWSTLPPDPERPEILLIIKLVYVGRPGAEAQDPAARKAARQRLRRELSALCEPRPGGCRRILLPELEPVSREDVEDWLEKHCQVDESSRARELAAEVFHVSGATGRRPMEELEDDLRELLKRMDFSGLDPSDAEWMDRRASPPGG